MKITIENKINELNLKLGLKYGQVGFYVLNQDAGLYDIRVTNIFGGTSGYITLGHSVANQFSSQNDAIEFINNLIQKNIKVFKN